MANSKIEPIEIDGETIWIEVEDIEISKKNLPSKATDHPSDLRKSATPVGPQDFIEEKIASVGDTLKTIVGNVKKGIDDTKPDEWSVELTIGFAGEKQIPFIAKGSVNGSMKVTAKWKK